MRGLEAYHARQLLPAKAILLETRNGERQAQYSPEHLCSFDRTLVARPTRLPRLAGQENERVIGQFFDRVCVAGGWETVSHTHENGEVSRSHGKLTDDCARRGLPVLWHAPRIRPHLGGGLDEGPVDIAEDGVLAVVRAVEEHVLGLIPEGV